MSSAKASRYLQLLNTALNTAKYDEIPELSRKVRKHDPSKSCYARSAEVQAYLISIWESRKDQIEGTNLNDPSSGFRWLHLPETELQKQKDLLAESHSLSLKSTTEDKLYYEVTNLFYNLVVYDLDAANQASITISDRQGRTAIQARTLQGILHELLGHSQQASELYVASAEGPMSDAAPGAGLWRQFAVYRLAILRPCQITYERYLSLHGSKSDRADLRRLHVLSTRPNSEDYRKELLKFTQFPPAEITNMKLLDYVSQVVDSWISAGEDPFQAEKILELLHEAASKTFHSPRLLRYLCHALTTLERFDEAYLCLKSYLQVAVHAQKTQPGSDLDSSSDIAQTVLYAIRRTFRFASHEWRGYIKAREMCIHLTKIVSDLHIVDAQVLSTVEEAKGLSFMLENESLPHSGLLENAIKHLNAAVEMCPTAQRLSELTLAHIKNNELVLAMSTIRQSLKLDEHQPVALLYFANLLCCEELYDRALLVLARIKPRVTPCICEDTIRSFTARTMELKIMAALHGSARALQLSGDILATFSEYFGVPVVEAKNDTRNGMNGSAQSFLPASAREASSNGLPVFAPQIPRVQVSQSPSGHSATSHPSIDEAHFDQTHERIGINGHQPSASRPPSRQTIRSASLKLSHPHIHIPHQSHIRKSASARSMRTLAATTANGSSRSSSPLNHPPERAASPLGNLTDDSTIEDYGGSEQASNKEINHRRYRSILADLWLQIAQYSVASEAAIADAQQAIEEARQLVGNTPAVLVAQLELNLWSFEREDEVKIDEDMRSLEEKYEFALDLDTTNQTTILSFVKFLINYAAHVRTTDQTDDGYVARAYEMLESLKDSPAAADPELWRLSADVAILRGEEDRAEVEYWKVVELSDSAGVIRWTHLT